MMRTSYLIRLLIASAGVCGSTYCQGNAGVVSHIKCVDISGKFQSHGISNWERPKKNFRPSIIFALKDKQIAISVPKQFDWFGLKVRGDKLSYTLYIGSSSIYQFSVPATCSPNGWQTLYESKHYVDGATTSFSYVNTYSKNQRGELVIESAYSGKTRGILLSSHKTKAVEVTVFKPYDKNLVPR